jgi:hypothetical protein
MQKNHKFNWFLDLLILAGFLLSFFLDLTGLGIHQWMGIALFLLIVFHLVNHWDWVKNTTKGFFFRTTNRNRIYGLIDLLLLLGMAMIIETGLVISTWFNLNLNDYSAWVDLHTYFSIGTLILTVVKIGLHWRWIVTIARKVFSPAVPRSGAPLPVGNSPAISRRQFLAVMGLVSLGSALAVANVLPKVQSSSTSTQAENLDITDSQSETRIDPETQSAAAQQQVQTTQPEATTAATSQPTTQSVTSCTYTCRRGNHCAFPGQCHDYRDSNNNGLCDKGECS